jgi:phosphoglycolate phosphatase
MGRRFPLRISAVTIDLDGTLADTIPDLACAANDMLAELGRAPLGVDRIRTFVGKGIPKLVERTLADAFEEGAVAGLMARALPIYERCYAGVNGRHCALYPGVSEGLEALRAMGMPLACVTNKSGRFTAPLLEQLGLAPGDMLVVGDSVNDAEAARAAGCPIFCVTYGYNEGRDVRELDVDAIVASLVEAVRLIVKT